ncbi:LysR family transcriptional regulator [Paraburkholderia silviterrae]|uniref:LysR family transcriptional regulator n=1 Tax=Paraburkholderia silviterrae TaxID=2528715 RepID=A0A4R5M6I4_9BURK|nr:LysR family transcriptional regulator [Paraburkholderia silviterrae]TDG21739.1 LysR family transcriptional regulator [Paraburkholderia silviterrae]
MIDSRQLQLFVTLAEDLHFARAADRLDIGQSVLSGQIKKLETDLGVRLLNRNKRAAVTLTDAGKTFLVEAVAALRQLERADRVGRLAARGAAGQVALSYVGSTVTSGLLPRLLKSFRLRFPDVRMQIVAMETPVQLEHLADGAVDVGLLQARARYPDGITARVLHSEQLMIAVSADSSLAHAKALKASQLRGVAFIAPQFNEAVGFAEHLVNLGRIGGFDGEPEFRVNDFMTAVSMAAAGYGVALVPKSIEAFAQPGVRFKPLVDFKEEAKLAIAYREREHSPCVRAFIDSALSSGISTASKVDQS